MRDEEGTKKPAVGVVDGAHETARRSVGTELAEWASVPLHHDASLQSARTPGSVLGWTASALGWLAGLPEDAAYPLSADGDALFLLEHLGEVGIVEVTVSLFMQLEDAFAELRIDRVGGGPSAAGVSQAGKTLFPVAPVYTPGLAVADPHENGRFPQGTDALSYLGHNVGPVSLSVTQVDPLSQAHPLREGGILAAQPQRTFLLCSLERTFVLS